MGKIERVRAALEAALAADEKAHEATAKTPEAPQSSEGEKAPRIEKQPTKTA